MSMILTLNRNHRCDASSVLTYDHFALNDRPIRKGSKQTSALLELIQSLKHEVRELLAKDVNQEVPNTYGGSRSQICY